MSFLGDLYKSGAGKEIERSAANIQDTLIDRPQRLTKEKEDRAFQAESRKISLREANQRQQLFTETAKKRLREEKRELAEHAKWMEEQTRLTERVPADKTFQSMTRSRVSAEHLADVGNRMGLIKGGMVQRGGVDDIVNYITNNVSETNRFETENFAASKKLLGELQYLQKYMNDKGKSAPSEGEESGTDKFNRIMNESWRTAYYNKAIPPDQEKSLSLDQIADLIRVEETYQTVTSKRAVAKNRTKVIVHKTEPDGRIQEQEVYNNSDLHEELISKGWKFGPVPKPPDWETKESKEDKKKEASARKDYMKFGNDRIDLVKQHRKLQETLQDIDKADKRYAPLLEEIDMVNEQLSLVSRSMGDIETKYNISPAKPVEPVGTQEYKTPEEIRAAWKTGTITRQKAKELILGLSAK